MKKMVMLLFAALFSAASIFAQNIKGKVVDGDGNPLKGANVKSSRGSTQTDASGEFSVNASAGENLSISYVGFGTVTVRAKDNMVVTMSQKVNVDEEIVVTGYRTLQKKATTGSVATVKEEAIKNVPIASFDQILQGQAAGALIQANSGQPGAAANVTIRGIGSITGTTQPLYIVDGVQISAQNFTSLNPNDFASVSVLKDASTTAQYGSRGANGVIVITTKKGKNGKTKFEYSGVYGESRFPENKLVLMNTNEKLDYEIARGNPYGWTAAQLAQLRTINTNWQDEITRTGLTRSHQLSASGGNEKTQFYLSGGLFNQTGTVQKTGLERYSGRFNIDHKASNYLNFGTNTYVGWSDYKNTSEANTGIATPLNAVRWANPYETPFDANGKYTALVSGQPNPIQELREQDRGTKEMKIIANGYAEVQLPFVTKGLSFRTNWGVDYENWDQTTLFTRFGVVGQSQLGNAGSYSKGARISTRFTGTNSINYAKNFKEHSINAGLYQEYITRKLSSYGYTGYGLSGNLQNGAGITISNTLVPAVNENATRNALYSYFTLINYNFRNKYFFNGSLRSDASSRFGRNKRTSTFYSIGTGWSISDEQFMKNVNWVNNLKLSISYGTTGNQEGISDFEPRELFGRSTYNGVAGPAISQLPNPDLTWEERKKLNVGLNGTVLKNRITIGVDFYDEITDLLFLPQQISRVTGFPTLTTNIGRIQNKGWEFTVITDNIKTKKFTWTTQLNFTVNRNKVLKLTPTTPPIGIVSGTTVLRVGHPFGSNFVVKYVGVNPANGNAVYEKPDKTTTETFSLDDRQIFGTRVAPYFGGVTNKFSAFGVDASIFFSFVQGNEIYNNDRVNVEDPSYYWDNLSRDVLREWRTPGQVTDIPRANQFMQRSTSRWLEDGSFIRLRNVQIGYSLPTDLLKKAKLGSVRLFVQGENLWTGFKMKAWDPELSSGALIGAQYPALRTLTGGVTIGF